MFGYGRKSKASEYKKEALEWMEKAEEWQSDALKWQEYQKSLNDAEMNKIASMVCRVHLVNGDVVKYRLNAEAFKPHHLSFLSPGIVTADERIMGIFDRECNKANTEGLHIEGSFYPSAQITKIERGKIKVKSNAQ